MRQGLSSQPVSQHPNKTQLELLFDPPSDTECDFHIRYPYPDENPYLETYPYPGAYPGAYPETYEVNDAYPGPSGYPYPGPEGYANPYPESRGNPNPNPESRGNPNPGPNENHDPDNPQGYPHADPRDKYPNPGYPSPALPGYPNFSYPSPGQPDLSPKSVRFPYGTNGIHPPSVDRPLTPYRRAESRDKYPNPEESSRDKYPLLTAESCVGKNQVLYTLEEQERMLYEGLCEQLLLRSAGGMSEEKRRSYLGIQSRDPRSRADTFIHLPANTVYAQPMSRWSSASDGFVSRDEDESRDLAGYGSRDLDAFESRDMAEYGPRDRFASLQDSLQLAVDRGVAVGHDSRSHDVSYGSRDCVYYRIRHRVSHRVASTALQVKRAFKRDDGEWRPKRFVSRLFTRGGHLRT